MAIFHTWILLTIITVSSWIVDSSYINRLNFGLTYHKEGKLKLISNKWLHIYRLEIPEKADIVTDNVFDCQQRLRGSPFSAVDQRCFETTELGRPLTQRCNQQNNSREYIRYGVCKQKQLLQQHVKKLVQTHTIAHAKVISYIETILKDMTHRPKRSFIHLGGIAKSWFGIADDRDMAKVSSAVKTLHQQFQDQALATHHILDHTVSALNLFQKRFQSSLALIEDNRNSLNLMYNDLLQTIGSNVAFNVHYITTINDITGYFAAIDADLMQYKEGLSDLVEGKLSPNLLPLEVVHDLFKEVTNQLASSSPQFALALQRPTDVYHSADFTLTRRSKYIYLSIHLPVAYKDSEFELYEIRQHPLPLTAQHPHMTFIDGIHTHLAISEARSLYFFPTVKDLVTKCHTTTSNLCTLQPELFSLSHPTCEYNIFKNNKYTDTDLCRFSVRDTPVKPSITPLSGTAYLLSNVAKYTLTCNGVTNARKGCSSCVLDMQNKCSCVVSYDNVTILPFYEACKTSTTTTTLKYPTNLMVLQSFVPHNDLKGYLADTLNNTQSDIVLPPLNLLNNSYTQDIANAETQTLDLRKVLNDLKTDTVSYRHLSEKVYHKSLDIPKSTSSSSFLQYIVYVLCGVVLLVILGLFYLCSKYRTIVTALAMVNLPKTNALQIIPFTPEIPQTTTPSSSPDQMIHDLVNNYYHHFVLVTAISILGLLLITCRKTFSPCFKSICNKFNCLNLSPYPHKTPKFQVILSMTSSASLIYLYLQKLPIFTPALPTLKQSKITRIYVTTIIPGILYKAHIVYSEPSTLTYEHGQWPLKNYSYVGYGTAKKIHKISMNPPITYQILLGRDGLYFCPPIVPPVDLTKQPPTAPLLKVKNPLTRSLTLPSVYSASKKGKQTHKQITTTPNVTVPQRLRKTRNKAAQIKKKEKSYTNETFLEPLSVSVPEIVYYSA